MAIYKCTVIDKAGKKQTIKREFASKAETTTYLKSRNYIIVSMEKSDGFDLNVVWNKRKKVKSRELALFCRQLQSMFVAGIPIVNCLEILRQQTENKLLRSIISAMYEEIQTGYTLSETLSNHGTAFPTIMISMVEAGEISGNLDLVMQRLAIHFEKEYKMMNKVKSAMAYPVILILLSVAIVSFLLMNVMPTFMQMYGDSPLPPLTVALINMSHFLQRRWYLIAALVIGVILMIPILKKNPQIAEAMDRMKLKVPIFKSLNLKVATARFTRTLATLMNSGVPMLQALDIVSGVTGNCYIGRLILDAKDEVRKGSALSQPLKNQGVLPPMVYSMMKIGEDSGTMEEILDKTADFYDEEVQNAVQILTAIMEPLMIIVMAVIIGFIVVAMVVPMFDMITNIQ